MRRLLATFVYVILLSGFSCHGQTNCPTNQGGGIGVGLCGPTADHLVVTPLTPSIGINQQIQVQATMAFSDGTVGQTGDFTGSCSGFWLSSSTAAATVNAAGLVTGAGAGTSTVSCTLPNTSCAQSVACTGSTVVTVLAAPNFTTPSQACSQPCPLPNGLGPPSAVAYSFTFAGTGGSPPYTWSVSVGSLPGWASLSSSTGALTGTPNAVATTSFTVQLCDTLSSCNTLPVTLQVVANNTTFFPQSTTSQLSKNKFAGTNSTIPAALAGTAMTTYSITSNVFTANVTNTFASGEIVGISGCSSATWMNGTVLTTNGSTTSSAIVGAWANTQGTALTHSNVGSTADTTCYFQGQGWMPFVTAPWPAPGSTNCTNGNPCTGQSGVLTTADINTWTLDWATPSTTLNTAPKNIQTMLTNPATIASPCHPSKSGETYDTLISLDDGAGGYFIPCVQGGGINVAHGHINATGCGGSPCFLMDTPTLACMQGVTGIAAFSITQRPGVNQALVYFLDISNNYQPTLKKETLTYSATSCSGGPGVTAGAATTILNFSTGCPANGFRYLSVQTNNGLATALPLFVGTSDTTHDTDWLVGLGTGPQNGAGKHQVYHIYNSGSACDIWDTQGYSGTALGNLQVSPGAGGSGYHAGDTIGFSLPGNVCVGTVTVSTVNGSGSVTALGPFTMTVNNGCVLGATMAGTGGTGSSLVLIQTQIGTPATTCCNTIWVNGSTVPLATTVDVYGIHGGRMNSDGAHSGTSGWGNTPQSPCNGCDGIGWNMRVNTLSQQTSNIQSGHPAVGRLKNGASTNPPYTVWTAGDTSCVPSTDCVTIFSPLPTGTQTHSRWPTPLYNDTYPIYTSSVGNVPKNYQPTNPPPWTGPFALSIWAIEQSGTTHWFTHSYINSNNVTLNEDFNANQVIIICSQDAKFCIVPIDCNVNWTYNVGCGSVGTVPYYIESAVMTN